MLIPNMVLLAGLGLRAEEKTTPQQDMVTQGNWDRMQHNKLDQAEKRHVEHQQAQQWLNDRAEQMEKDNAVLRADDAEVERLTAQLEAATKQLQAMAQEQARRRAAKRWWRPWTWGY